MFGIFVGENMLSDLLQGVQKTLEWLNDWLIAWLIDWLVDSFIHWFADLTSVAGSLIDWLIFAMAESLRLSV